jgi:hypothetical protein
LEDFIGTRLDNLQYAILSHTWGDNEISFQDYQAGKSNDRINEFCKTAAADGFEYVWVDTCCIDKSSSSELSEAINSMYRWYEQSMTCYVYLEDFEMMDEMLCMPDSPHDSDGDINDCDALSLQATIGSESSQESYKATLVPTNPLSATNSGELTSMNKSLGSEGQNLPKDVFSADIAEEEGLPQLYLRYEEIAEARDGISNPTGTLETSRYATKMKWPLSLFKCRWWSRGWTLQELIAPNCVEFYDRTWKEIGTKLSLKESTSAETHIPEELLTKISDPQSYNLATIFSWASCRKTTRVEGMAYCLLGLCDINMTLLYGEGKKAFRRLQEELLRKYEDFSLLVWYSNDANDSTLLAPRRSAFGQAIFPNFP